MASRVTQFRRVAPASVEQRGSVRHPVSVSRASVRRHGTEPADALLQDISIFGCRIQAELDAAPGERLWLRFPGGLPVGATVVWADNGFTGCRFDTPIDRAAVRALALPAY
jgi:hypothetical protein